MTKHHFSFCHNIRQHIFPPLHIDIFIEKHWNYLGVHWPHSKSFYLYLTFESELKLARVIFTYSCSFTSFVITRMSSSVTPPALSTSTFVHIQLFHEMPLIQEWLLATWHSERLHSGGAWQNVILPPDALMHCWESKSTHIHFASHMRVGMPKGCGKAFPPTFLCQRSELVGCAWKPCTVYWCDALLYVCLPRLFPSTVQLLRGRALISHCQSNSPLLPEASPSGRDKEIYHFDSCARWTFVWAVLFGARLLSVVQHSFSRPPIMYEGLVALRQRREKWSGKIEINRPARWMSDQ